ncbi:MAG TPA: S-methyl-5-thioribose-1-phosphate isomerase [Desulfobulbaceae bacterium]|nr:MAG: S-methyl-5-thioribose-1-phosphate isomerase [Deltaproteobacteria bacterium RIFOXYD12_FULL_53_23]HCC54069.1 S-methyl-5-thioribose-1-phosphate isomerase [Desulfobulbaceae bacterium]
MHVSGTPYRTIWPSVTDKTVINIIDQRHLPHRFVIEELRTVSEVCTAIREMHVRGAGLIGATAGFGMHLAALTAPESGFVAFMQMAAADLIKTRPTASNLAWAVNRQLGAIEPKDTLAAKRLKAFAIACAIADEDAEFCRRIGEHGKKIIAELSRRKNGAPVNILTHCNAGWLAFVDYGSATAPIYAAHTEGIKVHVWVDETRPWLQGAKLTTWELKEEGVAHTLIADNTGGHLMQHGLVDMVIVGTDRTTRCGDVANKIGTYLKALAAHDNRVPFYVALPSSTFDWAIRDGLAEIPIEQRSGEEITHIRGLNKSDELTTIIISPPDTPTLNYGFDVTPARLITGLISERGVMTADENDILRLYPEQR